MLDLVVDYANLLDADGWQIWHDVADIVSPLIARAIDERVIGPENAAALWRWLGVLQHTERFNRGAKDDLQARLNAQDDLRRAVQIHVLYDARPESTIWLSDLLHLERRMVGLSGRFGDVIWHLERLAGADNRDPTLREGWRDLMRLGARPGKVDPDLLVVGAKFQQGDPQLGAFVRSLQHPKKPVWQRRRERREAKRDRKRKISLETARRGYVKNRDALRTGDLGLILGAG